MASTLEKKDTKKGTKKGTATEIRPFKVETPEAELRELRARIAATHWPDRGPVEDQSQGPSLATMQALARHWQTDYDWRTFEAKLNSVPNFITEIDGLDIHFIHVRSKHEDALPIIISHGWPGSVVEQQKIIDPLVNPTAHGGKKSDAFHVVIPSMPGYGYSGKPTTVGWGPERIASAWITLMKRLGYERFVASGGDWGGVVVDMMGVEAPPELIGIHTNFPGAVRSDVAAAVYSSSPAPSGLTDEENRLYEKLTEFWAKDVAYALEMATRPQALYGIADSPIGLAAWLLDHDSVSLELIARVFDGKPEGLSKDDVLDNITHYWLTNSGVSSGRLYHENKLPFFEAKGVTSVPVAVSIFPDELYQVPRDWAEEAYPNLIYYNKVKKGGHFAAWEQPQLFSKEVRAGFRSIR